MDVSACGMRVAAKVGIALLVSTGVMMMSSLAPPPRSSAAPSLIRREAPRDLTTVPPNAAGPLQDSSSAEVAQPHKSWVRREPRTTLAPPQAQGGSEDVGGTEDAVGASKTHKSWIRREPKQEVSATARPAEWGRMMRREAPKTSPAADIGSAPKSGFTNVSLVGFVFALVALIGFARQVNGTITALLRLHPAAANEKVK
mmetsp:Transcript_48442/g.122252  ORF Transcript_48442/g.122252 Transcript_48442/m.122252 type:complete len:200 (+) Transcript_48442:106-705(+)